jgi:pseudouridine kinase
VNASARVVVVGGMNIDIQGKSLLPFRAGDSNPGSFDIFPGGVGRNIAENLARLGSRVALISVLGDDDFSISLEKSCVSAGIDLEGLVRLEGRAASHYLCLLDSDGSLAGAVADMASIDILLPDRLEERVGLLDSADIIILDANIPEPSIAWFAARYPKGGVGPILGFDPVSVQKARKGKAYIGSFSFAKPNRAEAALLVGRTSKDGPASADPAPDALAALLRAKGLGEAFISLGFEGLWAEGAGRERWIARLPERNPPGLAPVNSSGAGDAACAAIAWGILQDATLGERCSLALAASMLAAASESPVNPRMSAPLLSETAKGIERERIS